MRLPTITNDTAAAVWNAMNEAGEFDAGGVSVEYLGDESEAPLANMDLEELMDALDCVQAKYAGKFANGQPRALGGLVDVDLIEPIHSICGKFAGVDQLSDLGFWRWLSNVSMGGHFWNFIAWRYEKKEQVNWGITSPRNAVEVLLYRSWLRGHKMYDPSLDDPYEYAKRGSSDVWRSHILRQDFGKDVAFVRAFLDSCWDKQGNRVLSDTKIRQQLIPALRSWTSNATYSHLTYDECIALVTERAEAEI
ncbi:hypothetical protein KUV47_00410 [Vannielia litorea]|uniref:hypothetical protein n=1 Tax=Vannielia litorea TaxID=1217970 RepID=UPI001C97EC15|nr:hypothetical protein [Vannielia litorea]MBY6151659.1 hypothetical protein [Vannielia litorea]